MPFIADDVTGEMVWVEPDKEAPFYNPPPESTKEQAPSPTETAKTIPNTLPPPPSIEQQKQWEREATERGIQDTFDYVQTQWLRQNNLTLADIVSAEQILPGKTYEAMPGFVVPVGAKQKEDEPGVWIKDVDPELKRKLESEGKASLLIRANEFYAPGSTMYEHGFRTGREWIEAQRAGSYYGVHSGADTDKNDAAGSIIILDANGKPWLRATQRMIAKASSDDPIGGSIRLGRYLVPIKDYEGKEKLLKPQQAEKLSELEGKEQFKEMTRLGIIPHGSEFIPGKGNNWSYELPESVTARQKAATNAKTLGEFKQKNTQLDTGEWVDKDFYDKLDKSNQDYLKQYGTWSWNLKNQVVYTAQTAGATLLAGVSSHQPLMGDIVRVIANPKSEAPEVLKEHLVPFYRTAKYWEDMGTPERVISLTFDALYVAPLVISTVRGIQAQVKDYRTKAQPFTEATKQFLRAERYETSMMHGELKFDYGKDTADAFTKMSKATGDYALSVARVEDLQAATKPNLNALTKAISKAAITEKALVRAAENYKVKLMANALNMEEPTSVLFKSDFPVNMSARKILDELPKELPRNIANAVKNLASQGIKIRLLQNSLASAERALSHAKAKYPTDASKWADLAGDVMNKNAQLKLAQGMNINYLTSELARARTDLELLPKTLASASEKARLTPKLEAKVNELSKALADSINNTDTMLKVRYNELSGRYEVVDLGGILKTAIQVPVAPVKIGSSGGSPVVELTPAVVASKTYIIAKGETLSIPQLVTASPIKPLPEFEQVTRQIYNPAQITQVNKIMADATSAANELSISGKTGNEISQGVAQVIASDIAQVTSPTLRQQLQTQTKAMVKTAVRTAVQTPTQPKTDIPRRLEFPKLKGGSEEVILGDMKGAIAWKQGQRRGKPVIHSLKRPYKEQKDLVTTVGNVPPGAVLATGKGSAQRTARLLHGTGPKNVNIDMGAMDVNIDSEGKKVKLTFTPDPEGKTTYPISVGGHKIKIYSGQPEAVKPKKARKIRPSKPKILDIGGGIVRDNRGQHIKL